MNKQEDKQTVKNLKFYRLGKKKYILKKIKTVGLSIALASTLLLGGSFLNFYHNLHSEPVNQVTVSETVDARNTSTYGNITGAYQTTNAESISSTPIVYGESSFNDFNNYIDSYTIEYTNPEMFNYEEAHNYYANNDFSKNITHSHSGIIVNGVIDEEALLAAVKKNSPEFRRSGNHYMYQEITTDEEYAAVIRMIADAINPDLANKTPEELAEIDCTLADLKIYYGTGVESAKVTTERAMLINSAMIDAVTVTTDNDNAYRNIVYHESKHLEQIDCSDRAEAKHYQEGISRTNEELSIDPYTWTWIAEGAAEMGSVNLTNDSPTTYNYLVGYNETLDLISLTNTNNANGHAVEEATTDRDINGFYNLMGLNRGLSEEEITRMMYSMEIVQSRVTDYQENYQNTYNCPLSDAEYTSVREEYRTNFLLESTKIFYNNLAESIVNRNDLTMEDIYALISVYEGDLNFHLKYNQASNLDKDYNITFLQKYNEIQTKFFESIALANNMEISDIYEAYNNYQLFVGEGNKTLNCTLTWLDTDQRNWLLSKATGERISYTKPINLIVEDINQKQLK